MSTRGWQATLGVIATVVLAIFAMLTYVLPRTPTPEASPTSTSPTSTSPIPTSETSTSPIITSPIITSPIPTSETSTSPIPTSPIPTSPIITPAVRHRGHLVYTRGSEAIDLDTPQSDPEWGRDGNFGDGVRDAFSLSSADLALYSTGSDKNTIKGVFMDKTPLGYATCAQALEEQPGVTYTPIGQLDAHTGFCVRTSAKRVAAVTLAEEGNSERLVFDIVVWQKE